MTAERIVRARPWSDEIVTTSAQTPLDRAWASASDADRRRFEQRVLTAVRARAAAIAPTPENNPHMGVTPAGDVPAVLERAYELLEAYAAAPAEVDQASIDAWAHECTEVVARLRGAKSAQYEADGLSAETRRAILLRQVAPADRKRARRQLEAMLADGFDPETGA